MNGIIRQYIAMYLEKFEDWAEILPLAQYSYNNTIHESTGFTPIEMIIGFQPKTPSSFSLPENPETYLDYIKNLSASLIQLRTLAAMNLVQSKYLAKFYYDKKANTKHFREGEMVFLIKEVKDPTNRKFDDEYIGPCEITQINYEDNTAKIQKGNKSRVVHMDKLRRANIQEIPPEQIERMAKVLLITESNAPKYDRIKICSWNVASLKAVIEKGGIEYLNKENHDIIALQEVKCAVNSIPKEIKLKGYKYYFLEGENIGYCGVAILSKIKPKEVIYGLGIPELDKEARVITAEFDKFYLTNVYVPYSGLQLQNLPKRIKWNKAFEKYITNLENKKPVIICGDINVAHKEIDLAYPQHNINEAGFTLTERNAMDSLLNLGFTDAFRELYPNQLGAFTFWQFGGNRREKI